MAVLGVAADDQVARCLVVGERLAELLGEPGCPPFRPPSSSGDAQPRSCRRLDIPRDLRQPGRPDPGEPRAPPATCGPPTQAPSPSSPRFRSRFLDCPAPLLATMEGDAGHRPARDRHPLASRGVQPVLALEVAAPRCDGKGDGLCVCCREYDWVRCAHGEIKLGLEVQSVRFALYVLVMVMIRAKRSSATTARSSPRSTSSRSPPPRSVCSTSSSSSTTLGAR